MVLDLIIIGIILLLVIIGIKRGIAKTLLNVLAVIASSVCSYLGAGLLSNLIYSSFIAPAVTNKITDSMADSTASTTTIINEALDSLPEFVTGVFKTFGISVDELSKSANSAAGSVQNGVPHAVDLALKPVITSVLSVILMVVLFIIFIFVFKYIARKAEHLFHIPIVGAFNRILGGVLGFIEGALICLAGIMVCKVAFVFSQDPIVSADMLSKSVIFSAIYNSEILNNVSGFLSSGKEIVQNVNDAAASKATEIASAVR